MKFGTLLAYLLCDLYLVSCSESGACELAIFDTWRIKDIIRDEDSPERLSEILGPCQRITSEQAPFLNPLSEVIQYNRVESFKYLYPRFCAEPRVYMNRKYLKEAVELRRFDIIKYLMSQDPVVHSGLYPTWGATSLEDLQELKAIASSHPDKVFDLVPFDSDLRNSENAQEALTLIDFIEHCRYINGILAQMQMYQPSSLLREIIQNRSLGDDEMVRVLERLFNLGANIDQLTLRDLREAHPDYDLSIGFLTDVIETTDIKEPEKK